jgi:hypothetical protein
MGSRLWRLVAIVSIMPLLLAVQRTGTSARAPSLTQLRAVLEGTWVLEEWHVDGQVLKPPEVDGRRTNHDGVHLFVVHRVTNGTRFSQVGYGVYQIDASTWSYRYDHMETSTGPATGPVQVTDSRDDGMRPFKISQQGNKIILDGADEDRREYDGRFLTFEQKGQVIRKWRRVE